MNVRIPNTSSHHAIVLLSLAGELNVFLIEQQRVHPPADPKNGVVYQAGRWENYRGEFIVRSLKNIISLLYGRYVPSKIFRCFFMQIFFGWCYSRSHDRYHPYQSSNAEDDDRIAESLEKETPPIQLVGTDQ
eukprot:scaffold78743_cov22-Cyclotella_meneghiniana.AAC.1